MTMRYFVAGSAVLLLAAAASAQRQMENINRGVIAVRSSDTAVYLGWRLFATDSPDLAFNVYRATEGASPVKLNGAPLARTTDFIDSTANPALANSYSVRPVLHGRELAASEAFLLPAGTPVRQYLEIPLQIPGGGTADWCAGGAPSPYTYTANDGSVADLDGDGQLEIVLKWDPTNSKDNSQSGCTGPAILDAYKLDGTLMWRIDLGKNIRSGAHYTQFMVYDLDGDGKAELVARTADGTIDGQGKVIGDPSASWATSSGWFLTGPEYLTVFDGKTGAALATTDYVPQRGASTAWGDNYANRSDRFLAAIAYLDGVHPSVVECRGYYTRSVLVAWDWRDGKLTQRWIFDSKDPAHPEYLKYEGQGTHALSVADVDGDGKDEIVYGAAVIDHDGTGLYTTGWGHGDALHVSRFQPNNPDLMVYNIHEGGLPWAETLSNARTGALIAGLVPNYGRDPGRGMIAALDPEYLGPYMWGGGTAGMFNVEGVKVTTSTKMSTNFAMWWDADLLRELEDGVSITKFNLLDGTNPSLLTCSECASNNGTKANPVLTGDIFGDWREEVIWRTYDDKFLRIYTTTIPAANRLPTLFQDPQYRLALAWQNVAYNQPPWPSFYIGPGMSEPPRPNIVTRPSAGVTLRGALAGKSGSARQCVLSVAVNNASSGIAEQVAINDVAFTQTAGPQCTPAVAPAFPAIIGDLDPGTTGIGHVTVDFSSCAPATRVQATLALSANGGPASPLVLTGSLACSGRHDARPH